MEDKDTSVEVKVWIKDNSIRKIFIKSTLKAIPGIFAAMLFYYVYPFGVIFLLGSHKENLTGVYWAILAIFVMVSAVSILYAVGSGFQEISELEKVSRKTRIIFSQSKVEFIKGFEYIEKKWTEISKIKETIDGFRIYPNDEKSFFINEYAFHSRQDIYNFRLIARTQLNEKAKLKND